MDLTLARKVQLPLVLATAFVALVATAGFLSTRALGGLVDAYQAESLPALEALASQSTAVGRVGGGQAFEARSREGDVAAAWSRLQGPLAAWRKDLDALTASALERAARAGEAGRGFKERVGKSLLADKDADGKAFIAERVQIAKEKGKGWQEYKFMNPATKAVEHKVAYFELVDGVVITCGAYKP